MKRMCSIVLLILCISIPCAVAGEPAPPTLNEDLWPVVVLMHDGGDDPAIRNILLIVVNKSTGESLKATIAKDLFTFDGLYFQQPDSIADALQIMQTQLQVPLERYVCINTKTLNSLQPGEAKEKSVFDLMGLGFSLLGSVETNLSITETVFVFKMAFSQKDGAMEIELPQHNDTQHSSQDSLDWEPLREILFSALSELSSSNWAGID